MEYNKQVEASVNELIKIVEYDVKSNDVEKQVFAGFMFGMMNGILEENRVEPVVVHSTLLDQLILVQKYHPDEAAQFAEFLIQSTDRDFHPTMNIIIHRGINAFYDLKNNNIDKIKENYREVLSVIEAEE